jgi:hypothetical protein
MTYAFRLACWAPWLALFVQLALFNDTARAQQKEGGVVSQSGPQLTRAPELLKFVEAS